MERVQKTLLWAIVISETSHVFCCVLPTVFSLIGLMAALGLSAGIPTPVSNLHDFLHDWEMPMIIFSGVVLFLGWGLFFISRKLDCTDTGCAHEPCAPRKKTAHTVLKIGTILFLANVTVYTFVHRPQDLGASATNAVSSHDHHSHDHDHHHH